jgi:hypothetical protein
MKRPKKPPFTPPRQTIWVADLLTLEELFEEFFALRLIDRKTYMRYVALRTALFNLAEWMLLQLAGREIFEGEPPDYDWPAEPPEMPDEA